MSAEACLVFFGLRLEVNKDEATLLEERKDPRLKQARQAGLKHYWGDFGGAGEHHFLFIGHQFGILGAENQLELQVDASELEQALQNTRKRLDEAGFIGDAKLYLQWIPD
jgi:hypothetical protein